MACINAGTLAIGLCRGRCSLLYFPSSVWGTKKNPHEDDPTFCEYSRLTMEVGIQSNAAVRGKRKRLNAVLDIPSICERGQPWGE